MVPLDYAHPEGEQITLQIIRARHKEQSDRIGSVIFNPGGPGDPGVEYTPFLLSWLPEVGADAVRSGQLGPARHRRFCTHQLSNRHLGDPDPKTPNVLTEAGFARAARIERQQSQACIQLLGSRAPHFSTQAAARDIDRLRAAVGDRSPDLSRAVVRGEARRRVRPSVPELGARCRARRTVRAQRNLVRQQGAADQGLRGRAST